MGSNNKLNEISPISEVNLGFNEIDKLIFNDIILKILGCQDFKTFCL